MVLPIYFGLAIVVEEERLGAPARAGRACSTSSRAPRAGTTLLELAEETRLQAMVFQHNVFYSRERAAPTRAPTRYLDLLKAALLDEHYLENEARLDTSLRCLEHGRPLDPRKLRDPARNAQGPPRRIRRSREPGGDRDGGETGAGYFPYTDMGRARLDAPRATASTSSASRASRATSWSAAPGGAAAPSSCAATSRPTP